MYIRYVIFESVKKVTKLDEDAVNLAFQIKLCQSTTSRCGGVYLGIDLIDHSRLVWCLDRCPNSNALILGASGSGKTLTLATLSKRLHNATGSNVLILDVKGEYSDILRALHNIVPRVVDPLITPINPCSDIESLIQALESVGLASSSLISGLELACRYEDDSFTKISEAENYVRYLTSVLSIHGIELKHLWKGFTVLNLSTLYRTCPRCAQVIYLYILFSTVFNADQRDCGTVLVLDEAWTVLPHISSKRLHEVLRLARGAGVSILIASQSLNDLNEPRLFFENCSLIMVFVASGPLIEETWRYIGGSSIVKNFANYVREVGVCMVRTTYFDVPKICYVDPIDYFS